LIGLPARPWRIGGRPATEDPATLGPGRYKLAIAGLDPGTWKITIAIGNEGAGAYSLEVSR